MSTIENEKHYEAWPGWAGRTKKIRGSKRSKEKIMSETKSDYLERQKKNIQVWNGEIDRFKVQAEKLNEKKSEKLKKHITELKEKHTQLETALAEIQKSGEAGWEELKVGTEKMFKTLDKSFKAAKDYFH
jgi:predicted  nucleic acid-binding Zn-ribbon protein